MARIGILSMSDGRDFVSRDIASFIADSAEAVAAALRTAGHEVVLADRS